MDAALKESAEPRGITETRIVPLSTLMIPEYQRRLDGERAKRMASEWTDELFVTPRVRPLTNGMYEVLDGQHTVAALRILGEREVEVAVTRVSDAEAAGLFADLNLKRKALSPYATFVAELHAGRPHAVALHQIVTRYGCEVAEASGPTHLRCITTAYRLLQGKGKSKKIDGQTSLDRTVRVLTRTYGPSDARLSAQWIGGMGRLVQALVEAKAFDDNDLQTRLKRAFFKVDKHRVELTAENLPLATEVMLAAGRLRFDASRAGHGPMLYGSTLAILLYGVQRARELLPEGVR